MAIDTLSRLQYSPYENDVWANHRCREHDIARQSLFPVIFNLLNVHYDNHRI